MPKYEIDPSQIPQLVPDDEELAAAVDQNKSTNIGVLGFGVRSTHAAHSPEVARPEPSTTYRSSQARLDEIAHFTEMARQAEEARERGGPARQAFGHHAVGQVVAPPPRVYEPALPVYTPSRWFHDGGSR